VKRIVFLFLIVIASCVTAQEDSTETVILNAGNINPVVQFDIQKAGSVQIITEPIDADVELKGKDGYKYTSRGNITFSNLALGKYELIVSKNGYKSEKEKFTLTENLLYSKTVRLEIDQELKKDKIVLFNWEQIKKDSTPDSLLNSERNTNFLSFKIYGKYYIDDRESENKYYSLVIPEIEYGYNKETEIFRFGLNFVAKYKYKTKNDYDREYDFESDYSSYSDLLFMYSIRNNSYFSSYESRSFFIKFNPAISLNLNNYYVYISTPLKHKIMSDSYETDPIDETSPLYPDGTGRTFKFKSEVEKELYSYDILARLGFDNKIYNIKKLTPWRRFEKGSTLSLRLKTGLYFSYSRDERDDIIRVDIGTKQDKPGLRSWSNDTKFGDFPIIYGAEACHAFFLTDNSNIKFGLSYEYFKEKDKDYDNNKVESQLEYNTDLNNRFNISFLNSIEYYSYEVLTFPENADPEDSELNENTDSFTFLKFTGIFRFYPNKSWLVYGSINSTSLIYDNPDSTVLTFELGTKYIFDFNE
jgi:hypothetical protein